MQDKIIVTPSEVRGLGNIVSEKELEDFLVYMSTITSTSEEVDGITRKVYALGYVPPQVSLTLTMEKTVLDYDERTTLTATLLDENNVGIPNEEVKFYNENSYLFYTGTTDSNGVITINNVYSHQPGQHTYTGVLTSDTTVTGSVTVTINKITSTLSLVTSSAAVNVGGSFTLSGTLNAGSGKSVKIYQNGTVIDTVTTGTNGAYSKSITASAEGSFTYYAVFDGDSVYSDVTSSSVIVTVSAAPVPVPASIVLTSDKQVLSYVDQDSCTLSATVRDENDVLMEGVTVTFKVDGTSIGTAVTGSNGVATKTYDSQGVGDITCAAEIGMIVSETYAIKDALYYHADTVSAITTININLPSSYELSMKWTRKSNSNSSGVLTCTNGSRNAYVGCYSSTGNYGIFFLSPNNEQKLSSCSTNVETSFKITYQNGSYVMADGTNSKTVSDFAFSKISTIDGKSNCPVKEVLLMPL